jgi:hypothetical protein
MRREYYLKHREEILEKNKLWRASNQDIIKAEARAYRERRNELARERKKNDKTELKKLARKQRDYRQRHPERAMRDSKRWRNKNQEKLIHYKVHRAIQNGELTQGKTCQACGSTENIIAHHHDYSKPLEVIWLCRSCHAKNHIDGMNERSDGPEVDKAFIAKLSADVWKCFSTREVRNLISCSLREAGVQIADKGEKMTEKWYVPSVSLLVKIGSALVHAQEFIGKDGDLFDLHALHVALDDPDVKAWIEEGIDKALLPLRRDNKEKK